MFVMAKGVGVLSGAAMDLFKNAVEWLADSVWEIIEEEPGFETGIDLFDKLTPRQQLAMLDIASAAMLDRSVAAPKRSAVLEATVAAIYEEVITSIRWEIEDDVDHTWRRWVMRAVHPGSDGYKSCDHKMWRTIVRNMAINILPDLDFLLADDVLDMHPKTAMQFREMLGIPHDYFTIIAPEPEDDMAVRLRITERCKTGEKDWGER